MNVWDEFRSPSYLLPATVFSVTVDGSTVTVGNLGLDLEADLVTFRKIQLKNLSPAIKYGQVVTVSYTDLTDEDDDIASGVIEDAAGNDVVSFTTGIDGVPAVVNNVPAAPPGAPRNVVAEAFTGRVTLDWDPPESEGDAPISDYEYRRKRGTGDFEDWELVEDMQCEPQVGRRTAPAWCCATGSCVTGETFTYEVRAVNAGGPGPAQASNAIDLPTFTTFRVEQTEVRLPEDVGMVTFNAVMEVPDGWEPYDLNLGVTFVSTGSRRHLNWTTSGKWRIKGYRAK